MSAPERNGTPPQFLAKDWLALSAWWNAQMTVVRHIRKRNAQMMLDRLTMTVVDTGTRYGVSGPMVSKITMQAVRGMEEPSNG